MSMELVSISVPHEGLGIADSLGPFSYHLKVIAEGF